ncbi:MAG: thermonuclease family protein [Alphaproteobacteria bacterium]|nr:thermonuclease family protein [Alphaproteobacteria bacterium]
MPSIIIRLVFFCSVFAAFPALAQEAPPPRSMPRTPVSRQDLTSPQESASRHVTGAATVINTGALHVGKTNLNLFGIVPPQLSASFGPQARALLDSLAGGQNIACSILDRSRSRGLLAQCLTADGDDLAFELLKRGLAVTERQTLRGTSFASSYEEAERTAQSQKIGLWSVQNALPAAATHNPAQKQAEATPVKKAESTAPDPRHLARTAQEKLVSMPLDQKEFEKKIEADILSQRALRDDDLWNGSGNAGFFERYQLLISGALILATTLAILVVFETQRARARREELKTLAAALRGELMAARSICLGRARSITSAAEDRIAVWPRIRSTLYQAYVGRIGLLGADLARRIAVIYGQASDYASLYNPNASVTAMEGSKKQALETLIRHMDDVLPKLASIERVGALTAARGCGEGSARSFLSETLTRFVSLFSFLKAPFDRRVDQEEEHQPQGMAFVVDDRVSATYADIIEASMEEHEEEEEEETDYEEEPAPPEMIEEVEEPTPPPPKRRKKKAS